MTIQDIYKPGSYSVGLGIHVCGVFDLNAAEHVCCQLGLSSVPLIKKEMQP